MKTPLERSATSARALTPPRDGQETQGQAQTGTHTNPLPPSPDTRSGPGPVHSAHEGRRLVARRRCRLLGSTAPPRLGGREERSRGESGDQGPVAASLIAASPATQTLPAGSGSRRAGEGGRAWPLLARRAGAGDGRSARPDRAPGETPPRRPARRGDPLALLGRVDRWRRRRARRRLLRSRAAGRAPGRGEDHSIAMRRRLGRARSITAAPAPPPLSRCQRGASPRRTRLLAALRSALVTGRGGRCPARPRAGGSVRTASGTLEHGSSRTA